MYFSGVIFVITFVKFSEAMLFHPFDQGNLKFEEKNYQCFCTDGRTIKNLPSGDVDLIKKIFIQPEPKYDMLYFLSNFQKFVRDDDVLKEILYKLNDKPKTDMFDKFVSPNNAISCSESLGPSQNVPNVPKEIKYLPPSMYNIPTKITIQQPQKMLHQNDLQKKAFMPPPAPQPTPVKPLSQDNTKKAKYEHQLPMQDVYMRPARYSNEMYGAHYGIPVTNPVHVGQPQYPSPAGNYQNPVQTRSSGFVGAISQPNLMGSYQNPGMYIRPVPGYTQPANIGYNTGLGLNFNTEIPSYYPNPNTGVINIADDLRRLPVNQDVEFNSEMNAVENQNEINNEIENAGLGNGMSTRQSENMNAAANTPNGIGVPNTVDLNSGTGELLPANDAGNFNTN